MRSRRDLGTFLNRHQLLGQGAEVGVFRGVFAHNILNEWRGQKLFLVDPWSPQPPFDYQDVHNVSQAQHEANLRFLAEELRPQAGRYEVVRAASREASARFADGSLDFVYVDANHKYPFVRDDLRLWYPKVREGGFFGGFAYLNGVIDNCLFGVKRAVDEFASEHRLQIRLTYDKLASWFLLKPAAQRVLPKRNVGLLTAYDQNQAALAQWSNPNKQRYCDRHGYRFIVRTDGFDASRHPAWSKIKFIREHLPQFEWLFWSDADSLIMNGDIRLEEFLDDGYDLIIAQEDPGVGLYNLNTGQMFFRNSDWSMRFLEEVYGQTLFINDPIHEQRAVIHLRERSDFSEHVQVVTQKRFNSYPGNYGPGDFLVHFPDIPSVQRQQLMQVHHQFAII